MKLEKDFWVKDIIISEDLKNTVPRSEKLMSAEQHYLQTGKLPPNIVINGQGAKRVIVERVCDSSTPCRIQR